MATSTITNTNYSHRERISGFPYTPQHNGIITLLVVRGDSSSALTYRSFDVSEDGTKIGMFEVAFQTSYGGSCISFPCIANRTYTLSGTHPSNVVFDDMRTNIVY